MVSEGNLALIDLLLLKYKRLSVRGSGVGWAGGTKEILVKGYIVSAGRSNILKSYFAT